MDLDIKRSISVISSDPPCKDNNVRFTTIPLKPNLIIKNVDAIPSFSGFKKYLIQIISPLILIRKKCAIHFRRGHANENNSLK